MSSAAVLKPSPLPAATQPTHAFTPEEDKQISPSKSDGGKSTESGFSGSSGESKSSRSRPHVGIMLGSCADQVRKVSLRHFGL